MKFGEVCKGWSCAGWIVELRRKAERCERYRPDMADYYTHWAADIESRLAQGAAGRDQ